MLPELEKIKGVPPSAIILRELKKSAIELEQFLKDTALSLPSLDKITPKISNVLAQKFATTPDYFLKLQEYYNKKLALNKLPKPKPDVSKISRVLFWDTNFDQIDWIKSKKAVVRRVFERGSPQEKEVILSFYGKEEVIKLLNELHQKLTNENLKNLPEYSIPITFRSIQSVK